MTELVVLAGAESKLLEIYSQHESTLEGLGDLFDMELRSACNLLCRFPEMGLPMVGASVGFFFGAGTWAFSIASLVLESSSSLCLTFARILN